MKQRTRLLCMISLCALFLLSCKKETFSELEALQGTWVKNGNDIFIFEKNQIHFETISEREVLRIRSIVTNKLENQSTQYNLEVNYKKSFGYSKPTTLEFTLCAFGDTIIYNQRPYTKL